MLRKTSTKASSGESQSNAKPQGKLASLSFSNCILAHNQEILWNNEPKTCLDSLSLKDSGAWRQRGGKDVNCKGEFHTHPLRPRNCPKLIICIDPNDPPHHNVGGCGSCKRLTRLLLQLTTSFERGPCTPSLERTRDEDISFEIAQQYHTIPYLFRIGDLSFMEIFGWKYFDGFSILPDNDNFPTNDWIFLALCRQYLPGWAFPHCGQTGSLMFWFLFCL